jgi:hypothetical protein
VNRPAGLEASAKFEAVMMEGSKARLDKLWSFFVRAQAFSRPFAYSSKE